MVVSRERPLVLFSCEGGVASPREVQNLRPWLVASLAEASSLLSAMVPGEWGDDYHHPWRSDVDVRVALAVRW